MKLLNAFSERQALSVAIAVALAVIANFYFANSGEGWIILAAFVIGQTTRGTPLRQNMVILLLIAIVILCISLLQYVLLPSNVANIMPFQIANDIRVRGIDVLIGSVIGIACVQVIFPAKVVGVFQAGVNNLLKGIEKIMQSLSAHLHKKTAINENILLRELYQKTYPEWVFEIGFNPNLRAGFRFYLVNIDKIIEIIFSLNYLFPRIKESLVPDEIIVQIQEVLNRNMELMNIVQEFFINKKISASSHDYIADMTQLETSLKEILPKNLELLEMSPTHLAITAIMRDLQDLRNILLQLTMALPAG